MSLQHQALTTRNVQDEYKYVVPSKKTDKKHNNNNNVGKTEKNNVGKTKNSYEHDWSQTIVKGWFWCRNG